MASSQKQHYEHGLKNSSFKTFRTTFEPFRRRKIKSGNLKISLSPELGAISDREISDVRQKMKAVHQESVKIAQVKRSRLHSILFDNTNNKTDKKQIFGVILDTCSHFIRKRSRNSRYITFSSNLNESRSFNQNESYETCISEGSDSRFSGFRFKKINISFAALLVFAMCFFVSCGGGSSKPENGGDSVSNFGKLGQECYPNETCDEGLLCDTDSNICVEDPEDPTDTGSDKPSEQNNQNDQDTPVEQPDQDVPVNPTDVCHGEGCQGNRGCKPGYVWMKNASYYVDTGGDPDYHCVACTDLGESIVDQIRRSNYYCPGGDDLKGAVDYYDQLEECPKYTRPNDSLDDCWCSYGDPLTPKEDCHPSGTRKKPLIISPDLSL